MTADIQPKSSQTARVVVASTVALSFITFWQAAAVMLFSYVVRSIYMESCGMFVRGGVYVVVRDSIGPTMAKLSVSSLVVDYILTGPISAVAAGQYLGRLMNEIAQYMGNQYAYEEVSLPGCK